MSAQKAPVSPLLSVVAGATAGGIESLVTYPTEYIKTRQQIAGAGAANSSPLRILVSTVRTSGVSVFYTGVGAFCLSNASKSGIRFLTFDTVKGSLPRNKDGRPTPVANMLAGTAAGIAEGVTVVTPGENLKTKVVHDRATVKQYRSSTHALGTILRSEGISGLYRGVLPVTMKQGTNALVRFTTYGAILDAIKPSMQRNGSGALAPTIAGAMAGVVTVYATMPFDNVKTKMQALDGKALYRSTWHCFRTILAQSGVAAFWKGTTPRLIRLSVAGAISFSVYSNVVDFAQRSQTITIRKDTVAL